MSFTSVYGTSRFWNCFCFLILLRDDDLRSETLILCNPMASHIVGSQVFPEVILWINLLTYGNKNKITSEKARHLLNINDVPGTGFNTDNLIWIILQNSTMKYMLWECLLSRWGNRHWVICWRPEIEEVASQALKYIFSALITTMK